MSCILKPTVMPCRSDVGTTSTRPAWRPGSTKPTAVQCAGSILCRGASFQRAVVNSSLRSLPPEGPSSPLPLPLPPTHTAQHMTQPHAARDTQQQPRECGTQPRTQYHTHTRTQKAESRWGASSCWPAHCALAALPFACCCPQSAVVAVAARCRHPPPATTAAHERAARGATRSGQQAAPAPAPALSAALQPQRPNHQHPAPAPALGAYASAQRLLDVG